MQLPARGSSSMRLLAAGAVAVVAVAVAFPVCARIRGGDADDRTLRVALVPGSGLDPMKARTVDEQFLADQLFDTLVALDPETAEPGPGIAESWTTSDDGLRWEFTLAEGASFSDGEPLTAFDAKATLDRAVRKDSGSAVADLLEPVAGWRAAAVDGSTDELAGVVAVSDAVLTIELSAPWADLPIALAQPGLGIAPRAAVGSASFEERPVGSGPFRVADADADQLVLRPVKGRRARVDALKVRYVDDQHAAYQAFVDGDVDWSRVPADRVEEAAARYGRRYFRSYVAQLFYAFNLRNPKWSDPRLREAVVRAVDRDSIIEEVYAGTLRPMHSFIVDGLPGGGSDACGDLCAHDPEQAKALLAEVAASGGAIPEIAIDFEEDTTQAAVAERIKADLEAAGFTVELRPKPLAEYERFAVSGEQDLFRLGWIAAYPSADGFLAPMFASGSANNLPGFALSGVDELIRQARATADPAARVALYQQVDAAVLAELPVVPIGQFHQHWVASPRVRDLQLAVTGTFDATSVWLAD